MSNKKNIAITVDNISIRYRTGKYGSIKQRLLKKNKKRKLVEAVKNLSFELEEGEILGIIGKNGSGKSTMLRSLAGIFSPDEGSIDLHGKSVSLLSIGVGFQKKLSGRENIMLTGLLLGLTEKQVLEKMDDIIEFSGLGDFIDMPVKSYSSGMYSKLAFSITAIIETDIMLVDEVLSVGDQKFKHKSMEKMQSLIQDNNRTVVIVSHSIPTLRKLCTKMMWMHEGKLVMMGDVEEVLDKYEEFMESAEG